MFSKIILIFFVGHFLPSFAQPTLNFTVGGLSFTLEEDKCSDNCLKPMKEQAKLLFPNATFPQFWPDQLKIFCPKIYLPNKDCLDKCPLNNTALTARLQLEYECVEHFQGFVYDWPCMGNVSIDKCSSCSKIEANFDPDNSTEKFVNNCKKFTCYINCLSPYVKEMCGDSGVKFLNVFMSESLTITGRSARIVAGKQLVWPDECKSLVKDI